MGVLVGEEGCPVLVEVCVALHVNGVDLHHKARHASVEEWTAKLDRFSGDLRACVHAVYAGEDGRGVKVLDLAVGVMVKLLVEDSNIEVVVKGLHFCGHCNDLGHLEVAGLVALCPHVGFFNDVEVNNFDFFNAHGGELESNLSANGPDAYDEDAGFTQVLGIDDTGVSQETFAS